MSVSGGEEQEDYVLGLRLIESQHDVMASRIREVRTLAERGEEWPTIRRSLHGLFAYVRVHFDAEEEIMQVNAYPRIESHRRAHATFRQRLEMLLEEAEREQTELLTVILNLLERWFHNHEQTEDDPMMVYLRQLSD